MAIYYCKCGRAVKKSTKAATTGNRDTTGCEGCPYLLPYGPYKCVEGQGYVIDVQGHECRMTDHPVNYTTHTSAAGGPNDKTVLHVESLDFDFLESITEWVHETFAEGELTGGFQRKALRAPEFMDGYRVTFYPSSNKKGVAAKQALFRRFFHPDGTRLDMTPEEEKAKVLADIEAGKVATQEREKATMESKEQKKQDKPQECTPEEIQKIIKYIPTGWAHHKAFAEVCSKAQDRVDLNALLRKDYVDLMFNRDNLYIDSENTLRCDHDSAGVHFYVGERVSYLPFPAVLDKLWEQAQKYKSFIGETVTDAKKKITNLKELGLSDNCIRYLHDMGFEETDVDILYGLLPEEEERLQRDFPDNWERIQAFVKNKRLRADIDDVAKEESSAGANPTSSAAATVAAEEPVGSLEPAVLTPTTETVAATSEQADDAATPAPALDGMPAVFDYSGLSEQTVGVLHLAEREIVEARQTYICRASAAVAMVHEELVANCDGHNQHSDDTFIAWCRSVGLKKDAAYRLLQVDKLLTSSTPEEAAQLEQASPSLLYAAAKPSAPAELVQAVKDGDITTHKQYQEAMARIKTLEDQNKQLKHENEMERKEQEDANASAMKFKAECDRRAEDQRRLEGLVETANQKADLAAKKSAEAWEQVAAEKKARKKAEAQTEEIQQMYDTDMPEMQRFIDKAQAERDEYKALLATGQSTQLTATVTEVDQEEINRRAQQIAEGMMTEKMDSLEAGYPLEDAAYDLSEIFSARWDNAQMFTREIRTKDDWIAIRTLQETLADMVKALDEMLGTYEIACEPE